LRRRANSAELATLKKLVADGVKLSVQDQARLDDLQSAREKKREAARLRRHANSAELATLKKLVAGGEVLNDVQLARRDELQSARKRRSEKRKLRRQANSAELDALKQLVANGVKLNDDDQARLDELQIARKRRNEKSKLRYHAKRQKREDAACAETDLPFDERELDNSHACTLCNKLFSAPSAMKLHTSKFIPLSHLFFDYSITDITRWLCSENNTCFKSIGGEERDVLLNNILTMTKPLGTQATARRFEVTLPPGPLNVDIGVRNMMFVVVEVRNTVEGFPLCANDIIVSVNDTLMAKCEGILNECVDVFRRLVDKTKKVVILRYTTK